MLKGLAIAAVGLAAIGGGAGWVLTIPEVYAEADLPAHTPDVVNGERIFNAGGCASCHAPKGAKDEARLALGGGLAIKSDFGTFHVPNISPDPEAGIGGWSTLDFVNAMLKGVSPSGEHYYPAFPYTSYGRMTVTDVIDLKAFIDTLPKVATKAPPHELPFPFNIRRSLGLWKLLFQKTGPVVALAADAPADVRLGQYLVEGPGHCGECHTSRNFLGGHNFAAWLAGADNPDGEGVIPNITPSPDGIADWSADDIATSLETGFMPDYDSFGGSMVEVQENMARLKPEDRAAIAAYLKAIPALPNAVQRPATN